ncbi:DUF305 domain-containing protein [Kitasatospora sp. DSM 101779]|uniref:DUF305 domain-containing protein n=1 Tax=Kitasatospora sp. DSM 101779 TaxID=2853165 RepID=UPI0021D835EA|nr:DUF305 domain-containing protein [Kitasatospora sp. DSM 101779]MCU7826235.1 DUF305 domain-containing protein [Kitasatospora sp. DSM 101779]
MAALAVCGALAAAVARPSDRPAAGPASVTVTPATTVFNPTDAAWLQLLVPMTEQNIRLAELTANRATVPELRAIAGEIASSSRGDLARLQELTRAGGVAGDNPHTGHDMPGFTTAVEYTEAERATGADFDRHAVLHLREYLEQSVRLADSESTADSAATARQLAADLRRTRAAQLARLGP